MNTDNLFHRAKDFIKGYFDLRDELDDEQTAVQAVMDGVSFKGSNIIILIIAIFIASLGLNTNSATLPLLQLSVCLPLQCFSSFRQ